MAMILEDLHERYLPTKPLLETITLKDGTTRSVDCTKYHQILIGGDQLTVARVRGAVGMRITHDTPLERLTGMLPVIEDWYGRLTFMKVRELLVNMFILNRSLWLMTFQ